MKKQSRASERELSKEEMAKLSEGEFKALVIKMLTDLIELGQKMKNQIKDTPKEIKQNIQGTNSDRKKARSQSNNLEQEEKKEEEDQEVENLFEQIMQENCPSLAKEIDFQGVQEAQRVPKKWTQRGTHQGTSSLSYPRLKIKRKS